MHKAFRSVVAVDPEDLPISHPFQFRTDWNKEMEALMANETNTTGAPNSNPEPKKQRATLKKALMGYFDQYSTMTSTFNEEKFREKNKQIHSIMGDEAFNSVVDAAKKKYEGKASDQELNDLYREIGKSACAWFKEQNTDEE